MKQLLLLDTLPEMRLRGRSLTGMGSCPTSSAVAEMEDLRKYSTFHAGKRGAAQQADTNRVGVCIQSVVPVSLLRARHRAPTFVTVYSSIYQRGRSAEQEYQRGAPQAVQESIGWQPG